MRVLKFYASWCSPCKALSNVIQTQYKGDVQIDDVDIDANHEVAGKFGIRGVPTCVLVDDNDVELKRKVGLMTIDDFNEFVKV